MAVEHKRELQSVIVANKLVTAEYNDTFIVDGEVKAVAQDQDVFDLNPPVFVEESGKLRIEGTLPKGSDITFDVDGEHIHFQLNETVAHYQVLAFMPLTGVTGLTDSISNADGTDFYTVITFQKPGVDADADPVDVSASNVSFSAPVVALPDEVTAMLKGALGQ